MKVKDFVIEQTGGYVYVAWGSFEDGTYFSISNDILVVYDEDEYKAMDNEDYDGYEWENEHTINSYSYQLDEFKNVLKQIYDKCEDSNKSLYDLFHSIEEE